MNTSIHAIFNQPKTQQFHCLVRNKKDLPPLRSLLGLGLNFNLTPNQGTKNIREQLRKFEENYYRRIMFSNCPNELDKKIPKLYVKNEMWMPDFPHSNDLFRRGRCFFKSISRAFRKKLGKPKQSLLPNQVIALRWLLAHPEYIILNCDKNLGPAIMDRDMYLDYAYKDHLSDKNTYEQLTEFQSKMRLKSIHDKIMIFTEIFISVSDDEITFIERLLAQIKGDGVSFMYLLAKIHKPTLSTRAIISYSGSLCYGIACWIDEELKKVLAYFGYVAKSSSEVVKELTCRTWDPDTKLFTMDAVSMYTNIHLGHALPRIVQFFSENDKGIAIAQKSGLRLQPLEYALEVVMTGNIFQFGDMFFRQKTGTAMGTPPAPNYAVIYFGIFEFEFIPKFPELSYYKRYIDDGFGAWRRILNQDENANRIKCFKKEVNEYGKNDNFFKDNPHLKPLTWTFSEFGKEAVFLDLKIKLVSNKIETKIYEKELNLHLFLPPTSCHPPGVVKSIIFGSVYRAFRLNTNPSDRVPFLINMHKRLVNRGHCPNATANQFKEAISIVEKKLGSQTPSNPSCPDEPTEQQPLYLQLPYNPHDVSRKVIQQIFRTTIIHPPGGQHISEVPTLNKFPKGPADFNRLQVCYRSQKKLRGLLSPRKLRLGKKFSVKNYFDNLQTT